MPLSAKFTAYQETWQVGNGKLSHIAQWHQEGLRLRRLSSALAKPDSQTMPKVTYMLICFVCFALVIFEYYYAKKMN